MTRRKITLSIDEKLLELVKGYASIYEVSLDELVEQLLYRTLSIPSGNWVNECFALMDEANVDSKGEQRGSKRSDLYEVKS